MSEQHEKSKATFQINEDWLAVLIAFGLIVLAAIGLLGKTGINITF